MKQLFAIFVLTLVSAMVWAQQPVPAPPNVFIDTTWAPPSGATWTPHNSTDFQTALTNSVPGDTIVLDVEGTTTYTGNFTIPSKVNTLNKWIYIESAGLASLPPAGTRIDPSNVANMAKIVTPNGTSALIPAPGANYIRLVGLEITTASNQGCNSGTIPPTNCYTYFLFGGEVVTPPLPDHFTFDRDYIHGSNTLDVREGIQGNITYFAVIESYISDIHQGHSDSQAIISYYTPGPIKIVDNFLSATTEDLMFGGAGGYDNPYIPSDIEVRRNHFFKPLAWDSCGAFGTLDQGYMKPDGTLCPSIGPSSEQWVEKDNLEFKSGQRAIVTGNTLENGWLSSPGQYHQLVLTVRTSQSGNIAVVDDIEFTNNILIHGDRGINTLGQDVNCGAAFGYPLCTNLGESKRIWIHNNLIMLNSNPDNTHHVWVQINPGDTTHTGIIDWVFQHNTALMLDGSTMDNYNFGSFGTCPGTSRTNNVWILDNAIARQPSGDCGQQGLTGLNVYIPNPSPVATRYLGNVMFAPSGDTIYSWPALNDVPRAWTFDVNNVLLTPNWAGSTSDGAQAGWNGGTVLPSGVPIILNNVLRHNVVIH